MIFPFISFFISVTLCAVITKSYAKIVPKRAKKRGASRIFVRLFTFFMGYG